VTLATTKSSLAKTAGLARLTKAFSEEVVRLLDRPDIQGTTATNLRIVQLELNSIRQNAESAHPKKKAAL
jgi:hypothetical protein